MKAILFSLPENNYNICLVRKCNYICFIGRWRVFYLLFHKKKSNNIYFDLR